MVKAITSSLPTTATLSFCNAVNINKILFGSQWIYRPVRLVQVTMLIASEVCHRHTRAHEKILAWQRIEALAIKKGHYVAAVRSSLAATQSLGLLAPVILSY